MSTIHRGKWHRELPKTMDDLPRPLGLEGIDERLPKNERFLKTYVVPKECKTKIREELMTLGIHSGSLFPEIDKQAAYIKEQWRFDLPGPTNRQVVRTMLTNSIKPGMGTCSDLGE